MNYKIRTSKTGSGKIEVQVVYYHKKKNNCSETFWVWRYRKKDIQSLKRKLKSGLKKNQIHMDYSAKMLTKYFRKLQLSGFSSIFMRMNF